MRKYVTMLLLLLPLTINGGSDVPETRLTEWDELQLAIAITESRMNPEAVGKCGDWGIYQITPIYAKEASRLSRWEYSHEDAYSIRKSIEMFNIVQGHYNPSKDIRTAIKRHNPKASEGYYKKVMENLEMVKRYETIRKELIIYGLRKDLQ